MSNKGGKIIVFEGVDASGKGTQSKLLFEYLKKIGIKTFYLDFPQYDTFYGKLVAKFLRGELGKLKDISPYFAALTYALDRSAVKGKITKEIESGSIIVANRYVTSNLTHQAAKFDSEQDREEFLNWIDRLEYVENELPRENLVIYLDVDTETSARLLKNKGERDYLKDTKDIHEEDREYQAKVLKMYKILAQNTEHWRKIPCTIDGRLKSIDDIHKEVLEILISEKFI